MFISRESLGNGVCALYFHFLKHFSQMEIISKLFRSPFSALVPDTLNFFYQVSVSKALSL